MQTTPQGRGTEPKNRVAGNRLNVGNIEAAQVNFTINTFERLCKYYGVTLAEFFEDF